MSFLRTLLPILILFFSLQSPAQQGVWVQDSISMGGPAAGSYPLDVFYSLKNGAQKSDSNRNWHLAFEMTPFAQGTDVSILANYAGANVKAWAVNKQGSTHFSTLTAADTVGKISEDRALYNGPRSWAYGALNRTRNPNVAFDYGWGTYDQFSHDVIGDSLFLLKVGSSTYKLWVQNYESGPPYDSIRYTFRIASWDNSMDRTVTIRRSPQFLTRHFAYYDLVNNVVRDHEPAQTSWDVVFTRYGDTAVAGPLTAVYPVTGVLSNTSTEVARVHTLNPSMTGYTGMTYEKRTDMIGDDWKYTVGQGPTTSFALDSFSYFIKSKATMEYYLLQFTRFDGQATGKTVFRKQLLGIVTSVAGAGKSATPFFALAPNPSTGRTQLMLDAPDAVDAQIMLSDISGRVIQCHTMQLQKGLNAFALSTADLPSGTYVVTAKGGAWIQSARLSVQH